ncbi:hypothetical protein RchiOBHm_Chr6g0281111 [Rosa chinensis]|uniref:Uncharacterized protein n=1 Tax=Rosa chinensis TaxID=74649 RepID=A0A2P6PTE6_ROSCH|nr:hypothetical protein RchiOBHm_Chr6g0281111 [Rosa chinensis]
MPETGGYCNSLTEKIAHTATPIHCLSSFKFGINGCPMEHLLAMMLNHSGITV